MKGIRVHQTGPPEAMHLEEIEDLSPGIGQVLIQVKAAGVNPVDTYVRAGTQGYSPKLPYTPGADAAGIVEAVGKGASGISVGSRVYGCQRMSHSPGGPASEQAAVSEPPPSSSLFKPR